MYTYRIKYVEREQKGLFVHDVHVRASGPYEAVYRLVDHVGGIGRIERILLTELVDCDACTVTPIERPYKATDKDLSGPEVTLADWVSYVGGYDLDSDDEAYTVMSSIARTDRILAKWAPSPKRKGVRTDARAQALFAQDS